MSNETKTVTIVCETCGASKEVTRREVARGRGRFCSSRCSGIANAARLNATRPSPKTYADKLRGYQKQGQDSPGWKGGGTSFVCKYCGKEFKRETYRLKANTGHTGDFCSKECRGVHRRDHQSGPNSPYWVGGPKTYRGRNWLAARAVIVERQQGICAACGRYIGKSLPVHHIRPYREFNNYKEANDPSNLIGLCQSCHMKQEPRTRSTL